MVDISGFPEPLEHPPPHLKTGLLIALAIRNINKVYFVGNYSRHPFKPYHAFFSERGIHEGCNCVPVHTFSILQLEQEPFHRCSRYFKSNVFIH